MSTQPQLSPLEQLMQQGEQPDAAPQQPAQQPDAAPQQPAQQQLSPLEQLMQQEPPKTEQLGPDPTARQLSQNSGGADIKPVDKFTNPKLMSAIQGADMPGSVGTALTGAAGVMGLSAADSEALPVLKHIAGEYGEPVIQAIRQAAQSHPIVAKLLVHGLESAASWKIAKYLDVFGSQKH